MNIRWAGDVGVGGAAVFALERGTRTGARSGTKGAQVDVQVTKAHAIGRVKAKHEGQLLNLSYARWGGDNRRPIKIAAAMKLSGIGRAGLRVLQNAHYGSGPVYYLLEEGKGKEDLQPLSQKSSAIAKDVWPFHDRNQLERYYRDAILNHYWWNHHYQEMVVDDACREVVSLRCLRTAWCRPSLQDELGRSEWVIMNANWDQGDERYAEALPMADPYWTADEVRAWLRETGYRKFVRRVMPPMVDEGYFPDVDWHALYDNGWLDNTNSIPAQKLAIQKHQTRIAYHVRIPMKYWTAKYPDWDSLPVEKRDELMSESCKLLDQMLAAGDGAGKTFYSMKFQPDGTGPEIGWEIIAIDDKLKEGAFIPDADKGNSEILATLGVDWTLLGQGGGSSSGSGGGSGSDKREAYTILNALQAPDRELTTDAHYFIRSFNGWRDDVEIGYRQVTLTTLDKNPTGSQKTMQA